MTPVVTGGQPPAGRGTDRACILVTVVGLLRVAILVVMMFVVLSLVIAVGRPETGPVEKVILAGAVVALLAAARLVRRIGRRHDITPSV